MFDDAATALAVLDRFLTSIDQDRLFGQQDPRGLKVIRGEVADAFRSLVMWQRPELERLRGLSWPYKALQQRARLLEQEAAQHGDAQRAHQAKLCLAMLPFPRQWRWLIEAERQAFGQDPEIRAFLDRERRSIARKIEKKRQKKFKLRHFCQVLKKPRLPTEKGVLRIFSIPYIFNRLLLAELNRSYFIYAEPSTGLLFHLPWWRHYTCMADPVLMGVGGPEDTLFLQSQPGILTTPLAHGDYLEDIPAADAKMPHRYDIVFNATFDEMPRKRHKLMLELLQHPLLQKRTALFIGRGQDRNIARFRDQARQMGLVRRIDIKANLLRRQVPQALAQCRISVHLALYENVCRSIYESLRADQPCVISSVTAGMNPAIINSMTGVIAPDHQLPQVLARVLTERNTFSPRQWFLRHSGTHHCSGLLNKTLRRIFRQRGYQWGEDIVPLLSSGPNRYVSPSDYTRFKAEHAALYAIFQRYKQIGLNLEPAVAPGSVFPVQG